MTKKNQFDLDFDAGLFYCDRDSAETQVSFVSERGWKKGDTIINVGSGSGVLADYAAKGVDFINIDGDTRDGSAVFVNLNDTGWGTHVGLRDTKVNGIVFAEVVEHLENPSMAFRELWALAHNGCKMLVTTPNVKTTAYFDGAEPARVGHISPMTIDVLVFLIARAGWTVAFAGGDEDEIITVEAIKIA